MLGMTVFDHILLAILGFSILVGLMRGAVRELFSVMGWLFACYLASRMNAQVSQWMPEQIPGESIKVIAAFLLVFLTVLFVSALCGLLLTALVKALGLGGLNRILGGLAGAAKGVLLIGVLALLAAMTDLPKQPAWTNAMFSAPVEVMLLKVLPWLPSSIRSHVQLEHPQANAPVSQSSRVL